MQCKDDVAMCLCNLILQWVDFYCFSKLIVVPVVSQQLCPGGMYIDEGDVCLGTLIPVWAYAQKWTGWSLSLLMPVSGSAGLASAQRNVDWPLEDMQCCCITSVYIYTLGSQGGHAKGIIPLASVSRYDESVYFPIHLCPQITGQTWWHTWIWVCTTEWLLTNNYPWVKNISVPDFHNKLCLPYIFYWINCKHFFLSKTVFFSSTFNLFFLTLLLKEEKGN